MEQHNRFGYRSQDSLTGLDAVSSLPPKSPFVDDRSGLISASDRPLLSSAEVTLALRFGLKQKSCRQSAIFTLRFQTLNAIGLVLIAALVVL